MVASLACGRSDHGSQSRPSGSSTRSNGSSAMDSSPSLSMTMVHPPLTSRRTLMVRAGGSTTHSHGTPMRA
jgi:hypothetical protein